MTRRIVPVCCLIAACLVSPARADVAFEQKKDGESDVEVVRLTVTPAAEPKPALRHRLLPRDVDLKTGNAVPYYYRAMLNLPGTLKEMRDKFDDEKELGQWDAPGADETPIAKLPLDKVREADQMFEPIYKNYLRPAFQRSDCDWELGISDMRGPEMVEFLLPEFQDSREIARMLALRIRLAIAEHRYDDAIETIQQEYRLGHDVAKVPFLVCGLIGTAIDSFGNGTLLELMASPDSPNMYWALTEIPQPAINLQTAARFELAFGPRMLPLLDHAETAEHAPQEWNRLYVQMIQDLSRMSGAWYGSGGKPKSQLSEMMAGFGATGFALAGYSHAKEQLIAQGMDRQQVEKMAVGQVIAIYTERINRRYTDVFETMWYLPYADLIKRQQELDSRLAKANPFGGATERELIPIMSLLLPGVQNCRQVQARSEREFAALRVIEALRMYAAEHDGDLPNSLDDIRTVPVPKNPATGLPFPYRLQNSTAVLDLPASDDLNGDTRRYEIQVANNKK